MATTPDLRNDTRIKHKAEIQFENYFSDTHYTARMYNYSLGGMYFEADYAPLPGTEIFIGIKDSPYDAGADVYHAQIRWRRPLTKGNSTHHFGVGVRYCNPDDA
jgi:PilZ domain